MVLLKNSGSGTQNMWDLRLIATGSTNEFSSSAYGITPSASLQFRINNTANGASAITTNAFSCSTQPLPLKDGDLWNVLIQQNINNKYNLWVGKQDGSAGDKIEYFNQGLVKQGDVTSSILEITDADTNTNFKGFGGLSGVNVGHGNLVVGEYFTGSMAEIRVWKTALSASKFKQHILNKESVTGNSLDSHNTDLIYQYKLNENYISNPDSDQSYFESGSTNVVSYPNTNDLTQSIKDAVPENVKDYSFETYFNLRSGSLYTSYNIETLAFTPRIGGVQQPNTNKIITRPNQKMIQDLSPTAESLQSPYDELSNARKPSNKISIVKSPQKLIDFHIINKIADMDVSDKFGSPADLYEDSYKDLQSLRDIVFKGVSVKINKYIDAQKNVFTPSLISAVTEVLPVRAEKEIGVAIKPDLLQRSKYKWNPLEIQSGSQAGNFTMEVNASNILTLTQSTQESYYESNEIYATGSSPVMENNTPYESNEISGSPASVSSEELSQNETTIIISASDFSATKIDVNSDDIVATGSAITMTDVETFDDKNGAINLSHNYVKFKLPWKDINGNDYQFPQYQERFEGSRQNKGKDGDYNVGFFEKNMIFKTIGDYEMLSASANSVGTGVIDFENERYFLNKELDDFGNERGRTSQISSSIKKEGAFDIETLHYPKNHWINYHTPKEQLHIYKGTQGTGSKFTVEDPRKLDIYPTMSFYTIEVGGSNTDNTLKVIRNKDGKGAKGRR